MQSKCAKFEIKKSRFVKEQEAKGLLSSLGLKTRLSKVPFLGHILFWVYEINKIVNKFLLAGDKFMHEIHLKQPGFTYSACGPFTKNKERINKFMKTGNTDFIYRNDLDKACFSTWYGLWWIKRFSKKNSIRQSDKVLRDKAFEIASNPKYDGYQRGSMVKILVEVV